MRLIDATLHTVAAARRTAHRRPLRASRSLSDATALLATVSVRLRKAAQNLAEMNEYAGDDPETAELIPELVAYTKERWELATSWLDDTVDEVSTLHRSVLHGLETGTLVPERRAARHRRIVLGPRPITLRAIRRFRRVRVRDRIASFLLRRRRTPRPAALRVPRRDVPGRAPPLDSLGQL